MGEEVQRRNSFERGLSGGDDDRVMEWETGLPSADDLTPLSQSLIPPELASAFSISPQPHQTMLDVNRASQNTLSSLRRQSRPFSSQHLKSLPSFDEELLVVEGDDDDDDDDEPERRSTTKDGSDARKIRRLDSAEEVDSVLRTENSNDNNNNDDHPAATTLKRPRLMWTPQLHKRFVDVVAHLGIKNAVPKTIMQMMNVEGLTRENVASHLQKYRLYLKRMQGLSNEGPSSSDHLFSSTPVPPQSFHDSGASGHMPLPMPYFVMPMPVIGDAHSHGHLGMPVGNPTPAASCHGFDPHSFNMFMEQQREWSGNKFGPAMSYPHVDPKNK